MLKLIMIAIILAFLAQTILIIALILRIRKAEKCSASVGKAGHKENKTDSEIQTEADKNTDSILEGIENNEFKMYLQFIVDNKTIGGVRSIYRKALHEVLFCIECTVYVKRQQGIIKHGNAILHYHVLLICLINSLINLYVCGYLTL